MINYVENRTGDFTIYSNRFAQSPELSFEAKAVLRYLLSKPDTWNTCKNALKNALGVGRCVVDRVIKELVAAGYLLPRSDTYVVLEDLALAQKAGERGSGIVRFTREQRKGRFAITSNAPFLNARLSLMARGVLCYLLTMKDSWDVYVPAVAKAGGVTDKRAGRAIKELEIARHIVRTPKHDDKGRLGGWTFDIFESPLTSADLQTCGTTVDREASNQHVVITDVKIKIEENKPLYPQQGKEGTVDQSGVTGSRKSFDVLAAEYPAHRKGNLDDAFGEYKEALRSGEPIPNIPALIDAVRVLIRSEQWTAEGGKYIPRLKNWIHNRQWLEVMTLPETPVLEEWTPQEILAAADKKVTAILKRWQASGRFEKLTPDIYQQAVLACTEIASWSQCLLSGGHDSVIPRCSRLLAFDLADTPGLQAFLEKEHQWLLEAVRSYTECGDESAG